MGILTEILEDLDLYRFDVVCLDLMCDERGSIPIRPSAGIGAISTDTDKKKLAMSDEKKS
jgi:hypothetical protein